METEQHGPSGTLAEVAVRSERAQTEQDISLIGCARRASSDRSRHQLGCMGQMSLDEPGTSMSAWDE